MYHILKNMLLKNYCWMMFYIVEAFEPRILLYLNVDDFKRIIPLQIL